MAVGHGSTASSSSSTASSSRLAGLLTQRQRRLRVQDRTAPTVGSGSSRVESVPQVLQLLQSMDSRMQQQLLLLGHGRGIGSSRQGRQGMQQGMQRVVMLLLLGICRRMGPGNSSSSFGSSSSSSRQKQQWDRGTVRECRQAWSSRGSRL
jgi:hypothetical protein